MDLRIISLSLLYHSPSFCAMGHFSHRGGQGRPSEMCDKERIRGRTRGEANYLCLRGRFAIHKRKWA
jgi:hypothetical protein